MLIILVQELLNHLTTIKNAYFKETGQDIKEIFVCDAVQYDNS